MTNMTDMTNMINKSDFINNLSDDCEFINEAAVEKSVNDILDLMKKTLADDGRVEIRGFGSFSLNHRKPRIARNPKTGEQIKVGSKAIPHFKPGKLLREAVKDNIAS